ncbi:MAG: hypothetical protein HYU69_16050 [Bacteroidetes bacterium]|nr:hypothetical protein [Bacteroidota bacterium]
MLFSSLNIEKELLNVRPSIIGDNIVIDEVRQLFENEIQLEQSIKENLRLKKLPIDNKDGNLNNVDRAKVFSISEIEKVCMKYRLRFLKTGYYKNEFPYEAVIKIKEVQRKSGKQLNDLYLIAPAEAFELQDRNKDPLLFAHIGNNNYYLIYKWGTDLSWQRKFWSFPFRNIESLAIIVVALAFLAALIFPASFMLKREVPVDDMIVYRSFVFIWCIIAQGAALTYAFLAFHKNFSSAVWRSHYFN